MAKDPEARYQTAWGAERDLRRIQEQLVATGGLSPFELGRFDRPTALRIPAKLYGRGAELAELGRAIGRACHPERELVRVVGEPGIGKSALVSQSLSTILSAGVTIVTGKCDHLPRGVPYLGMSQAFRRQVRQLMVAPEATLANWRPRLQEALGPNGGVVAPAPHVPAFASARWGAGSVNQKRLPRPGSLATPMRPPWASTMDLLMLSPRPVPPRFWRPFSV